jgi:hypothetical protein
MTTLRTLSILTAFGVISAASAAAIAEELAAQNTPDAAVQGPAPKAQDPASSDEPASVAGANERAAGAERQAAGDTKPKDKLVGLPVESAKGEQLGSVVDIVRDKAGTPTFAVVAIDTDTTAVPYDTALGMVRGNKVVMSQAKLAAAPKVKQSEWLDQTHSDWRADSSRYWGGTRTASKPDESKGAAKKPADR